MESSVTPWIGSEEWFEVYHLIISLEPSNWVKAEEILSAWQCRVDRLHTGVETTLCLLQAANTWRQNPDARSLPLTLSAAIIRFLNLTSHVGFNKFGIRKIQDVAGMFHIPTRLVELRHDTTHGEMRSQESLLEGLALALQWTIKNYWEWEVNHMSAVQESQNSTGEDFEEFRSAKTWLECFQYLKIYSIWGNETMGELKNNPDTFDHISDLWKQLGLGSRQVRESCENSPKAKRKKKLDRLSFDRMDPNQNIEKMKLREGLGLIRDKVKSWLSSGYDRSCDRTILKALVEQNLLLPDKDFVESLLEDGEKLATIRDLNRVPVLFAKSWSDILKILSESGILLVDLVRSLHEVCKDENPKDNFSKDLASAWISDIFRALQANSANIENANGKSKSKQKQKARMSNGGQTNTNSLQFPLIDPKSDSAWQSLFQDLILNPNERTLRLMPQIFKLVNPPLGHDEERKLTELANIYMGKKTSGCFKESEEIKTLDSIVGFVEGEAHRWRLVDEIDWESVPLGLCPGQSKENFLADLSLLCCHKETNASLSETKINLFERFPLEDGVKDWSVEVVAESEPPKSDNDDSRIPAFYRSK